MIYKDLLEQQKKERYNFDKGRFLDQEDVMQRQKTATDQTAHEAEKQKMFAYYKAKDAELLARHEKERQAFLKVKEVTPEPSQTDKAAQILEEFRNRQKRPEQGRDGPSR